MIDCYRESMSEHLLTVVVRDQGTPAKRNFARVEIRVSDANDHAPEWTGGVMQGRVLESADIGTAVVTVLASDKDHGKNAALTYSIVSGKILPYNLKLLNNTKLSTLSSSVMIFFQTTFMK